MTSSSASPALHLCVEWESLYKQPRFPHLMFNWWLINPSSALSYSSTFNSIILEITTSAWNIAPASEFTPTCESFNNHTTTVYQGLLVLHTPSIMIPHHSIPGTTGVPYTINNDSSLLLGRPLTPVSPSSVCFPWTLFGTKFYRSGFSKTETDVEICFRKDVSD